VEVLSGLKVHVHVNRKFSRDPRVDDMIPKEIIDKEVKGRGGKLLCRDGGLGRA
jgi:hypothetical protein